jgi:4-aminobutyrate aminotransferase
MSESSLSHLSPVWTHLSGVVVDRAEGATVYTSDGRRYLDFTSGIGVTNTGHCHPRVVAAVQAQAAKVIHAQINIYYHRPILELIEALQPVVPAGLDRFFFSNSGAEAVEASIKLARQATGKPNIIVFQGSFHGRTVATMSCTTSKTIYRLRYQPLMPGVFVAPYPYAYYYGWEAEETSRWCLKQLRHLLASQTDPSETAAILVEPVLGEGGYVPPPPSFLPGVRRICDEHDILLIADEVQSGFGRTGRFFALEHFEVTPDIMVMAKGLGSGFPISGIAARQKLMDRWVPGSHGGTFGGNAVCCAAAAATVRVIEEEGLVEKATRMGEHLLDGLHELQARHPAIGDVRGLGLMVGTEFTTADGEPDKPTAKAVQQRCLDRGLFLLTCGSYDNVIRWIPPLVVNAEQIEQALGIFAQAL